MRRRYRWDKKTGELYEVLWDSRQEALAPTVWSDLEGYQSPATGKWVEGRKARREDLKRSGCRPYEGKDQEMREAAKIRAEEERRLDSRIAETTARNFYQIPYRSRKILEGK